MSVRRLPNFSFFSTEILLSRFMLLFLFFLLSQISKFITVFGSRRAQWKWTNEPLLFGSFTHSHAHSNVHFIWSSTIYLLVVEKYINRHNNSCKILIWRCARNKPTNKKKALKTHTMSSQEECPCARTFIEMSWILLCTAWTLTSSVQLFVSVSPFYLVIESGMVLSFVFLVFFLLIFYFVFFFLLFECHSRILHGQIQY